MSDEITIKEFQKASRERAVKVDDNHIKVMEEVYEDGKWVITKTEHLKLDICKKIVEKWGKEIISK